MKTLQNFLTSLFAVALMTITLISLDSCRKSDDVTPSSQQNNGGGNVAAISQGNTAVTQEVSAKGILYGEGAPNSLQCGGFVLMRMNAPYLSLMSAELNLSQYVGKYVALKGYVINNYAGSRTTIINVYSIQVINQKPSLSDQLNNTRQLGNQSAENASTTDMSKPVTADKASMAAMSRPSPIAVSTSGILTRDASTATYMITGENKSYTFASAQLNLSQFINKNVTIKGYPIIETATATDSRMTEKITPRLTFLSIEEKAADDRAVSVK